MKIRRKDLELALEEIQRNKAELIEIDLAEDYLGTGRVTLSFQEGSNEATITLFNTLCRCLPRGSAFPPSRWPR